MLRRLLLSLISCCLFAFCFATPAAAVDCTLGTPANTCYWVPGSGAANWSATTNWSLTSGGVSCVCSPAATDSVVFDANSGTNGSTISANISVINVDMSASSALTLTHNSGVTWTVTGTTFKFGTNVTYTKGSNTTSIVAFTPGAAATVNVTNAGKVFAAVTVNGATDSITKLADDMSVSASATNSTLTLTQGTLDANNHNVTTAGVSTSGSSTRAVLFGSGTWTLTGGAPWTATTSTNLTLTPSTATIVIPTATVTTFAGGGATGGYPAINYSVAQTGAGSHSLTGANTFASISITAPHNFRLFANQTVTGAATWTGTAANPIFWQSSSDGAATTLTLSAGGTIVWGVFKDITFAGTAPTITNSLNLLGNSGATINTPVLGGGGIIGG